MNMISESQEENGKGRHSNGNSNNKLETLNTTLTRVAD